MNDKLGTEPAAPEPLGDSEGTATQVAVGPEPVAYWDKREQRFVNLESCGRYYDKQEINELLEPLYSAATVERLVQERNGWIDSAREFSNGLEYYRDQLDACARHIGLPCFTADDGGVHEEPLRAKVAEEVGRLVQERDKYKFLPEKLASEVKEQLTAMTQERDAAWSINPTKSEQVLRNQLAASQARILELDKNTQLHHDHPRNRLQRKPVD